MTLELILRKHDVVAQNKGVSLADTMIHLLSHADDVVIIDHGDDEGLSQLEDRVNNIEKERLQRRY